MIPLNSRLMTWRVFTLTKANPSFTAHLVNDFELRSITNLISLHISRTNQPNRLACSTELWLSTCLGSLIRPEKAWSVERQSRSHSLRMKMKKRQRMNEVLASKVNRQNPYRRKFQITTKASNEKNSKLGLLLFQSLQIPARRTGCAMWCQIHQYWTATRKCNLSSIQSGQWLTMILVLITTTF